MFGLDYLGGAKYGDALVKGHPLGFAAGFFADTFGNCFATIDKLCATGKCPLIRVHGPWTAHQYYHAIHDKPIFAALEKVNQLKAKYPKIVFQFSPICESDASGSDWERLIKSCDARQKNVEIIVSIGKGSPVRGYTTEIHGNTTIPNGNYQYSYDGTNTVDSDVEDDKRKLANAKVIFFWHPAFNCKYKTKLGDKKDELPNVWKNDTAPAKDRIVKPTVELIQSIGALAKQKGKVGLKAKNLYKSHADRHNTPPEPRAYKPVLISPEKVDFVTLVDEKGRIVAKSDKREPYKDGRFRYYFNTYGYLLSDKPLIIIAGSKVLGQVNPGFREGEFR